MELAKYKAEFFKWEMQGDVGIIRLNNPEHKNPLTFESYAELRDLFRNLAYADDVKAVVFASNGGNFCSGGDIHDIIAPLFEKDMKGLLEFTRMTGDLIKAMIKCGVPIISAIEGICVGAGAMIALASDIRFGTKKTKTAFLFTRVGLAGCDMGACALLPRVIGQGRASELLFTGRVMTAEEGLSWGFYNKVLASEDIFDAALKFATDLAEGPNFGHMMTKTMLAQEWDMSLDAAIEAEAQAQAICMKTKDFGRAYKSFISKKPALFEGD